MGPNENQYAILDEDKTGLALYLLPSASVEESAEKNGALDPNSFSEDKVVSGRGPLQFVFEADVDRIFSTPLGKTSNNRIPCLQVMLSFVGLY